MVNLINDVFNKTNNYFSLNVLREIDQKELNLKVELLLIELMRATIKNKLINNLVTYE